MDGQNSLARSDDHRRNYLKIILTVLWMEFFYKKTATEYTISSFCGFYWCFYCKFICRGVGLLSIVKMNTSNTGFNDSIVRSPMSNEAYSKKMLLLLLLLFDRTSSSTTILSFSVFLPMNESRHMTLQLYRYIVSSSTMNNMFLNSIVKNCSYTLENAVCLLANCNQEPFRAAR